MFIAIRSINRERSPPSGLKVKNCMLCEMEVAVKGKENCFVQDFSAILVLLKMTVLSTFTIKSNPVGYPGRATIYHDTK